MFDSSYGQNDKTKEETSAECYVLGSGNLETIAQSSKNWSKGNFYYINLMEEQWEVDAKTSEIINERQTGNDKWIFVKIVE